MGALVRRARILAQWTLAALRATLVLPWVVRRGHPVRDVTAYQRRIPLWARRAYSQNGEDGILDAIFAVVGTTNRVFVEFGVEDGQERLTRHLQEHRGWTGLLMDGRTPTPGSGVRQEFVTAENVEALFEKYDVPERFDLLGIDIDGNDYWVWTAITRYRARVVVVEYNSSLPALPAVTVPYDPAFVWDHTQYQGASLGALEQLGQAKGYRLIACDRRGVNAFFVDEALAGRFVTRPLPEVYRPPAHAGMPGQGHPPDPLGRPWVQV